MREEITGWKREWNYWISSCLGHPQPEERLPRSLKDPFAISSGWTVSHVSRKPTILVLTYQGRRSRYVTFDSSISTALMRWEMYALVAAQTALYLLGYSAAAEDRLMKKGDYVSSSCFLAACIILSMKCRDSMLVWLILCMLSKEIFSYFQNCPTPTQLITPFTFTWTLDQELVSFDICQRITSFLREFLLKSRTEIEMLLDSFCSYCSFLMLRPMTRT